MKRKRMSNVYFEYEDEEDGKVLTAFPEDGGITLCVEDDYEEDIEIFIPKEAARVFTQFLIMAIQESDVKNASVN